MIIGTAGHIDHGKSSLVRALTGIDPDRLKEEKARGITLDLGFAYTALKSGQVVGFVDVPGHEKLVRNMLAGATGIDHVLLAVAADDGPMPQTREHLAIVELLGLERATVALTKCDAVSPQRLTAAVGEVRSFLAESQLAEAPIFSVSSVTGQGLEDLSSHLSDAANALPAATRQGWFRLAVDRSFSLAGAGTVVTGTASAGSVGVGDRLMLCPSGLEVRVRGIRAQNLPADSGHVGQRLAVNLAGVDKSQIRRGDWLVAAPLHAPTSRIDVRLKVLSTEPRSLAHWTPVHLHLGAEDVNARVVLLESTSIEPGKEAFVQLELDRRVGALRGDRFIVRDQSALRTMGGGLVIDAFASPAKRRRQQRVQSLAAMSNDTPSRALADLLKLQPPTGVDARQFSLQWNLPEGNMQTVLAATPHRSLSTDGVDLLFAAGQIESYAATVCDTLSGFHRRQPDSPGMTQEQLQRTVRDKPARPVFEVLLRQLVKDNQLKRTGPHICLPTHDASLQGVEKHLWERIKPWLDEGGIHPPRLTEMLLRDRQLRKDQILRVMTRLQRMGAVHPVGAEYFIQTQHMLELALKAHDLARADDHRRINLKEFRESTGVSRHLCLPLIEYFDSIGLTKRDASGRHFRSDPRKVFMV